MTDRVVLCMKWGTVFPASHVNMLFRAVSDHLSGPFRFVCLTDEPEGLAEGVEHFPIPDLGIPPDYWRHGAWPKLAVYANDLYGLRGRCLFIDLDTVIVGNLDAVFEREEPFLSIGVGADWRRGRTPKEPDLGTGVIAFDLGENASILDAFQKDADAAFAGFPNEQSFVEAKLKSWTAWPSDWVVSFKRHLCRPIGADLLLPPRAPDPDIKIVAFHGDPRPADLVGRRGLWTKPPHSVRCPVDWLEDYFRSYGDDPDTSGKSRS